MNLSEEVDLEDYIGRPDKISAADIQAICQEAGMLAVRKNRYIILPKDFESAYKVCLIVSIFWSFLLAHLIPILATSHQEDGRVCFLPVERSVVLVLPIVVNNGVPLNILFASLHFHEGDLLGRHHCLLHPGLASLCSGDHLSLYERARSCSHFLAAFSHRLCIKYHEHQVPIPP